MDKEKLVELGEEVAQEINKLDEVKAVAFYGSIGRGYHDEKSDVDLVAYVDETPDEDERSEGLKEVVDKFETQIDWIDVFHYKSVEFGVSYKEISDLKDDIEKLKEGHGSGFVAMFIQNVRPIIGEDLIYNLKDRIEDYPEELKDSKKVKLRGVARLFIDAEKLLERQETAYIYSKSQEALERLVEVVYSINERYYPEDGLKWFEEEMERMDMVPEDFEEDVRKFINLRPIEGFPERLKLLKEMMFSILDILGEVDEERLNIRSEEWYDKKIKNVKKKMNFKIRRD